MVCPTDSSNVQRLEVLYRQSLSISWYRQLVAFLKAVNLSAVDWLARDRREPRISKYFNVEGQAIWYVYDPTTGRSLTTSSEYEVRNWLESLYYQR